MYKYSNKKQTKNLSEIRKNVDTVTDPKKERNFVETIKKLADK